MERKVSIQAGLCLVGCLHLIAFTSLLLQFPTLFGRHGVQPISSALRAADNALQLQQTGGGEHDATLARWTRTPSLLWLHGSLGLTAEAMFALLCCVGFVLAAAAACGVHHCLVFTGLWAAYLSFVNVGGAFLEAGDDILLEVTFASVWLAAALQSSAKRRNAWREYQLEHLSTPVLLLLKWVLFKLLLINSTFSASMVCATAPGLTDCYRALVAHGQPTALTSALLALPGPLAFAATTLLMLELPAAFLLLFIVPSVQRSAGSLLLGLQLVRIALGPASLTNLATAGLCVLAVNNGGWIPAVARFAACLGWDSSRTAARAAAKAVAAGPAGEEVKLLSDELFAYLDKQPPPRRTASNCSITSLFQFADEQGSADVGAGAAPGLWQRLQDTPRSVAAAIVAAFAAVAVGYTTDGGAVLRYEGLTQGLHYCVPFAMAWFLVALLHQSWRSVTKVISKSSGDAQTIAAGPLAVGVVGGGRASSVAAGGDVGNLADVGTPPISPRAPATAAARKHRGREAQATPSTAPPKANGHAVPAAAAAAAAEAANGEDSDPAAAAGAGQAAAGRRRRGTARAVAAEAGDHQQASAGVRARRGPRQQAAAAEAEAAAAPAPAPPSPAFTVAAGTPVAATPSPGRSVAATPGAAPTAAALAAKARQSQGFSSRAAAWAPVVLSVVTVCCVLGLFLAGAPAVWQAGGQRMDTLGHVPLLQQAYEHARYWGVVSGTAKARAAFRASAVAAARQPGSVLAYEVYAMSDGAAAQEWQRVGFKSVLAPTHAASAWEAAQQGVAQLRGWYEPRLQAKMAAAGARDEADEDWLASLTSKIVEGAPQLSSVLQAPPQPHSWATLHEVSYEPAGGGLGWGVAPDSSVVVKPMSPGSLKFKSASGAMQAEPGDDGWLVSTLEQALCQLEPAAVVAALLAAVVLRHMLLSGGLLNMCADAVAARG